MRFFINGHLGVGIIKLRLAEDLLYGVVENVLINTFDVVAVQEADVTKVLDQEDVPDVMPEAARLMTKTRFLFHKDSINHLLFSFTVMPLKLFALCHGACACL